MADKCSEAANKICSEGKTEQEAGWNEVGTGITPPEQPAQNISPPNVTQPSENRTMTTEDALGNVKDLLCPGFPMIIFLVGLLFVKIK